MRVKRHVASLAAKMAPAVRPAGVELMPLAPTERERARAAFARHPESSAGEPAQASEIGRADVILVNVQRRLPIKRDSARCRCGARKSPREPRERRLRQSRRTPRIFGNVAALRLVAGHAELNANRLPALKSGRVRLLYNGQPSAVQDAQEVVVRANAYGGAVVRACRPPRRGGRC